MRSYFKSITTALIFAGILFWAVGEKVNINNSLRTSATMNPITVGIYPLSAIDSTYLSLLKSEIELFYHFKVVILKGSSLPKSAYYAPRNRYRADSLLNYLLRIQPSNTHYIVGITAKDISCTNGKYKDWGVFGLGFLPGKSCVISTYRLRIGVKNESHFRERLSKVVLHELGHNLGLDHCKTKNCFMHDANGTIKSVDAEEKNLCSSCRQKLKNRHIY